MEIQKSFCVREGNFNVQNILELIQLNSSFDCEVYVKKLDKLINAKSILGTMNLFIYLRSGEEFTMILNGEDAEYAEKQITKFFEKHMSVTSTLFMG
ncbi:MULTISPECIES: HPr family phosphocarrier protein [Bacillaceae]|uniref:HPr family phosphocarrier protein n=1 Tax=Evansella alkalicola TaxID=745819 RepID=A0ABS6JP06_9BACI|nr:HPr family phosphocarrier protein [Litchfieldia alkalitelluris]MBU9720275.1 HPr family phosphocarrier protein [Bacillus alkalicola]